MPYDLRVDRLSKTYPNGVKALQNVSLTIPAGMFGLLGPNGAGKSTLMRILATLQEPDEGDVRLGPSTGSGQAIDVVRQKEAVRETLGYLPQDFGLYRDVAAEKLLDHFAVLEGIVDRGERRATVEALLTQTNLWDVRKQKLGGYSGGMRQRFGIALALLGNPKLLIVDEPTAGLDPAERVRFLNLLSELGENSIVILSTHIVEDVSELCTRMAIIDKGEILLEAEPLHAVREMEGRVWERLVSKDELPAVERNHDVLSTKLLSGRTVVRVFSETQPSPAFHAAEPELHDVYFSVLAGLYHRPFASEVAR
ncbi:MAG TPA: ABC transporter ATP-binding protein [Thermoanaerobaculia bacterium]|nr:ABC transporter ATP-binding protein [Thermoanaerobaculia bacterium]